jgi:type I restriction enzyme R subunit
MGWESVNCLNEIYGPEGTLGREAPSEVVLIRRLREAMERLNPDASTEAITLAIEELMRDRSAMVPVRASREVYELLKNGIRVFLGEPEGDEDETVKRVRVIDWNDPANNDYFLAKQFWITGDVYRRRADLVGFVNGLPLVFIELKASHKKLEAAYRKNLRDYRSTIPQVFWYNAFVILSNGSESVVGSTYAEWEHFKAWKKINSEGQEGVVSLETVLRGTCEPRRLLDVVENFVVFLESRGGLVKILARNHQYLGVNSAIASFRALREGTGKLGVFWHTQGSGKSISMIFFSQKILRKYPGNWTFVVVTDRKELDEQIYKTFARVGAVTEKEAHATSGEHLKQLLREDHRYVFTLIQKFRTERGEQFPRLSDRRDVIVITDEAHRSQYDTFALNMRNALPNAAFIGFTGTPLLVGEEKTREVFGDYVSIYNFKQSADDGSTVPLYYENRIPELQLANEDFNEDMERLLEEAELDEDQERKLAREFSREYHLITRDDRLERVAEDIVSHFMGRGHYGKAMVLCIDKATAVRMYDKVTKHWEAYLARLRSESGPADPARRKELEARIRYMEETDMAVVVSQSQNEVEEMKEKGVDILPHRRRIVSEDLDTKFKDPEDPFRIVFVCAMWMTGFDVPSCSTIYLDKPMRNHTLMQAIARANRVFGNKVNGLIVDYVGIFRDLKKALAIYGSASGGGIKEGETPIRSKAELVRQLQEAIEETTTFCEKRGINLDRLLAAEGFEFIRLRDDAVEAILANDETKRSYLVRASNVAKLFKAILPDPTANEFGPVRAVIVNIAEKIHSLSPEIDISGVMESVENLLDESVTTEGYVIQEQAEPTGKDRRIDLSKIDFEALKKEFDKGRKRTEAEKLRVAVEVKLERLVRLNQTRIDYMDKLQKLIDEYNSGSYNVEQFFQKLVAFAKELNEEEKRGIAEQLSEEELAIFDLLTKPEMNLNEKERSEVKKVAGDLLATLKKGKLVLDWRKKQQARASVRLTVEETLDRLPRSYTRQLYHRKCNVVYKHIYDSYYGSGRSVYSFPASGRSSGLSYFGATTIP